MADTSILPPEEQRLVLRLLSYWRELAGERPMPAVDDIDGTAIQDMWGYCFLLEGPEGGLVFRFVGEHHVADLRADPTGQPVSGVRQNTLLGRAVAYSGQVVDRKVPITLGGKFVDAAGRNVLYRSILMPVASNGATVLLGGANSRVVVLD